MSLQVEIYKKLGDFTLDAAFETYGGVLGMLGASGCGKSITLKCIAGIETPDRGRIVLDGVTLFDSEQKINLPPQKRQVGYLFQNYALFPNMTVRQNILCGLCREKDKARRQAELEQVLELLQLQGLEQHRPAQLSGGQQQRVALARILVNKPRLLMLDEPFSALDSHRREKLQLQMREMLAGFGCDVLMVTHSRDEAYHMCRRVAVMDSGRLLAVKDTKELFADPGSIRAALLTGCKNIAAQWRAVNCNFQRRISLCRNIPPAFSAGGGLLSDHGGLRAGAHQPGLAGRRHGQRPGGHPLCAGIHFVQIRFRNGSAARKLRPRRHLEAVQHAADHGG